MLLTASFSKDALISKTKGQVNYFLYSEAPTSISIAAVTQNSVLFPHKQTQEDTQNTKYTQQKVNRKVEYIHCLL